MGNNNNTKNYDSKNLQNNFKECLNQNNNKYFVEILLILI